MLDIMIHAHTIIFLIMFFYVDINDITALVQTGLHHLQDGGKASVQGREVRFREKGGHVCQRILSQRLPHDVTQTEAREEQETQAKEGRSTDSGKGGGTGRSTKSQSDTEGAVFHLTTLSAGYKLFLFSLFLSSHFICVLPATLLQRSQNRRLIPRVTPKAGKH